MKIGRTNKEVTDIDSKTQRLKKYPNIPKGMIVIIEPEEYKINGIDVYLVHFRNSIDFKEHTYYARKEDIDIWSELDAEKMYTMISDLEKISKRANDLTGQMNFARCTNLENLLNVLTEEDVEAVKVFLNKLKELDNKTYLSMCSTKV